MPRKSTFGMRRWQILFLSMLFALPITGQAKGVDFFQGTIYQALDRAKVESKLLLVEFHAPWSHKSRWMHEVLSQSDVSEWFIALSLDTQTEEGAAFAVQYAVTDYPVILVCNSGGVVIDKIDRTLDAADFLTRLSTARLSTDRQSVRQLQQIFTLCEQTDSITRDKVNQLVANYLATQQTEALTSESHWDLFSTPSITYYRSASYVFMLQNVDKFFAPDQARKLSTTIISDVVMPYVVGSCPFDAAFISSVEADSLSLACYAQARDLCALARLRDQNDAAKYVDLLSKLIGNVNEDYEYQLVMSLAFVVDLTDTSDRSVRMVARSMLQKLMQKSLSPVKTALIESLLAKFL